MGVPGNEDFKLFRTVMWAGFWLCIVLAAVIGIIIGVSAS